MGVASKKYTTQVKKTGHKGGKEPLKTKAVLKSESPFWLKYALLGGIIMVTFWCYHYSLGNEFTNWDDDRFVTQNDFIKSLSPANLKMILFHNVKVDNYVPLTMISYAINYHFSGLSPQSYYLTNIVIHVLNCCLLFFLMLLMLAAMEKNGYGIFRWKEWLAFFCTMAFAIHPMHVESVSWMAERKDVLYTFFYFAGMIAYIHYSEITIRRYLWLFIVFVCFLLSVASKPMAIVFPFSLLAIDVLLKRDKSITVKNIVFEKLPFILVAILSAVITYHLQKVSGTMPEQEKYNFFQRFLFASHNFYMYILKAFIPLHQSSFYPFPALSGLPLLYYLSPFIALLVAAIPLYLAYLSAENNFRVVIFGLGFYFINIIMVSQIINAGLTIMADRYSYVCYLGIFFPATYFTGKIIQSDEWIKKILTVVVSIYLLFFAVICYQRTFVWHNSETLWTNVIEQYPQGVSKAYTELGVYYLSMGNDELAYSNLIEATRLDKKYPTAYGNIGLLMDLRKQYDSALYYYTEAIQQDNNYGIAYMNRGIVYSKLSEYELAMKDFKQALLITPNSERLVYNMAIAYRDAQQFDSSISYFNKVIRINPSNPSYFRHRGMVEFSSGDMEPAITDLIQTLGMNPNDAEGLFYLSNAYSHIHDFTNAFKYAQLAQNAQYPVSDNYIEALKDSLKVK